MFSAIYFDKVISKSRLFKLIRSCLNSDDTNDKLLVD